MTTIKWPTLLAVLLVAAIMAPACGLGQIPSAPNPIPSGAPVPVPSPSPFVRPFNVGEWGQGYGFMARTQPITRNGTMWFRAEWIPLPTEGQVWLFIVDVPEGRDEREAKYRCYEAYDGFACPEVVARAMEEPRHPQYIEYQARAGQRLFIWVVGRRGNTFGTVSMGMR